MKPISHLLASEAEPGSFPIFLQRRASSDPAAKTWHCFTCRTIAPREIKPGLYLRRSCACEERQHEEREAASIRQQIQSEQRAQTCGWMGPEWAEPRLEGLTFAAFDRRRQAAGI